MTEHSGLIKRLDSSAIKNLATVVACVLLFTVPISAQVLAAAPTDMAGNHEASKATVFMNLDCLEQDESEVTSQMESYAKRTMNILPASIRNRAADERIIISIEGTTYFSAVVSEQANVEQVRTGRLEDPTIKAETDCVTIQRISTADSPSTALEKSISQNDIEWEGVSASKDAAVAYGSKSVQTYHIVKSGETGDVKDGADGFTNGLVYD